MWEKVTPFQGDCICSGVKLHAIWDVNADDTYSIQWPEQKEDVVFAGSFAMCYTLEGAGRIELKGRSGIDLTADSLFVAKCEEILTYRCLGEKWRFHWIEFSMYGQISIPLNTCISLPHYDLYSDEFYELTAALQQGTELHQQLAASIFLKLICEWSVLCQNRIEKNPHLSKIQSVIAEMHHRISENWTVAEMSRMSGMSEPSFRQAFRSITGKSPKKFYNELKLTIAQSLLKKNTLTVSEVSDQLGFCDPFHFSKVFKQHFGCSPSERD